MQEAREGCLQEIVSKVTNNNNNNIMCCRKSEAVSPESIKSKIKREKKKPMTKTFYTLLHWKPVINGLEVQKKKEKRNQTKLNLKVEFLVTRP